MCVSINGPGLVTLTFDLLTLKLVCESHLRWKTCLPNFGTLGLWVLELFALYTRRTDGQTYCLSPTGGGIINLINPVRTSRQMREIEATVS